MRLKKYKRIAAIILMLGLLCALVACGQKNEEQSSTETETSTQTTAPALPENDMVDPENADLGGEQGSTVTELVQKTGKANGIDVSKWQGKIDWQRVKAAGVDFAIIRVGYRGENGEIYKDSYADYNIQQADKAGILVGVYFFSTAIDTAEAEAEANWLLAEIDGYPISYPVVYNCEGFLNENSRMYELTNAQRTDNAVAFLNRVKGEGYEGMFYAAKAELEGEKHWETARLEKDFMIWVARYPATPYPGTESPDYSGQYDMWQYTDKGVVDGIEGNADMIVSYFVREKKQPEGTTQKEPAKVPESTDALYTAAEDEVTAKIEVNLRRDATTKSDVVGVLKNGTFVKRVATGANGWSRLEYNGQTVYAISSYLTTDRSYTPPPAPQPSDGFVAASGKVTAKQKTNLRSEPSEQGKLIATIQNGEFVEQLAVSPKGWTRLSYKGQTVYAKTSLLTTEVKAEGGTATPPADQFAPASGRVTAKLSRTNLRTGPSTVGTEVVYTLPKGEFAERTGEGNGWTRLSYKGQTVYAISSYLVTEQEYKP